MDGEALLSDLEMSTTPFVLELAAKFLNTLSLLWRVNVVLNIPAMSILPIFTVWLIIDLWKQKHHHYILDE